MYTMNLNIRPTVAVASKNNKILNFWHSNLCENVGSTPMLGQFANSWESRETGGMEELL